MTQCDTCRDETLKNVVGKSKNEVTLGLSYRQKFTSRKGGGGGARWWWGDLVFRGTEASLGQGCEAGIPGR